MIRRATSGVWVAILIAIACNEAEDDPAAGSSGEESGTTEPNIPCDECDEDESCHSQAPLGHCVCDAGWEWVDPENEDDFTCMPIPPRDNVDDCVSPNSRVDMGMCWCEPGFNWCSEDVADLTCCQDDAQASEDSG